MKRITVLLAICIAPFFGFSQTNYAINPTFVDASDWTDANAGTGQGLVVPAESHTADESTSYKIVSNGTSNSQIRNTNVAGLTAGDYIFGYWVKGTEGVDTRPQIRDNGLTTGQNINGDNYTIMVTDTWEYVEQTFSVSGNGTVSLRIFIKNSTADTAIQVDDVSFVKAPCVGYQVTLSTNGLGSADITTPLACYATASDVEVSATACSSNYEFSEWLINDVSSGITANPYTYTVGAADAELKAIFTPVVTPDVNFDTDAELANWTGNNGDVTIASGDLVFEITGKTPKITYNCAISPTTWGINTVKIGYTNATVNTRLRFKHPKEGGADYNDVDGLAIAGDETNGVGEAIIPLINENWVDNMDLIEILIRANDANGDAALGNFTFDYIEFLYDPSLSTDEVNFKDDSSISLYPNPVKNQLSVKSKFNIDKLEIYSILGKKALSTTNSKTVNVSSLTSGLYVVKVFQDNGAISTKRFIKQ